MARSARDLELRTWRPGRNSARTALIQRGVPVVFYTGTAVPPAVLEVYPTVPVVLKPAQPDTVLLALFAEITGR